MVNLFVDFFWVSGLILLCRFVLVPVLLGFDGGYLAWLADGGVVGLVLLFVC